MRVFAAPLLSGFEAFAGRLEIAWLKCAHCVSGAGQEAENIGGGRRPERAGKAVAEGGGGSGSARRAASRRDKGAKGQTLVKTVLNKYSTTYSTSTQQPTQQPTQQVVFLRKTTSWLREVG